MTRDRFEAAAWKALAIRDRDREADPAAADRRLMDALLNAADEYRAHRITGNAKEADEARMELFAARPDLGRQAEASGGSDRSRPMPMGVAPSARAKGTP